MACVVQAAQQPADAFRQGLCAAGAAALLCSAAVSVAPAKASEFDVLAEPTPTSSYFVDDASVLNKLTKSDLNKKLKILEISSGYRVEVVTVRKLEVETDPYVFADQVLANWYPEGADKKGILLVVTSSKDGALTGGAAFTEAVGDDLIDSIVGDNIPIYTEQEAYNETVESSLERIIARFEGKADPGAPQRADTTRKRTYKTKEETDKTRNVTATVVGTLLLIAVVVPMLQYWGYTAKD